MPSTDKTIYNFDRLHDRRNSDSVKWNQYEADVLPLWVADLDFVSPAPVIRALRKRVEHGIFGYPQGAFGSSKDLPEMRQTIIERLSKLYNWHVQPADIVLMPGVMRGFHLACHAFAAPGGAVLVQTPVYPPILNAARTTGVMGQEMELTRLPDGTYAVDWEAFEDRFTAQTRLFILCNPHNPVGKVFAQAELEHLAEICLRHGAVICSDEIHCDLVYEGATHIPIAGLHPDIAQNTITLMAPSKTFNLAGLEFSLAIIQNPELRKTYLRAAQGLVPPPNLLGVLAAQAAYEQGNTWLEQLLTYLQANRDYLYQAIQDRLPGVRMALPQGTYLAWLDCQQSGIEGNPQIFLLEKARVALNDGETFGRGGQGFVRLNFGCTRAVLEQALERMERALVSG